MFTVPTAFARTEQEYRQQRIKAGFPARSARRIRLADLFKPRRRSNPQSSGSASLRPLPAPHHLASR